MFSIPSPLFSWIIVNMVSTRFFRVRREIKKLLFWNSYYQNLILRVFGKIKRGKMIFFHKTPNSFRSNLRFFYLLLSPTFKTKIPLFLTNNLADTLFTISFHILNSFIVDLICYSLTNLNSFFFFFFNQQPSEKNYNDCCGYSEANFKCKVRIAFFIRLVFLGKIASITLQLL